MQPDCILSMIQTVRIAAGGVQAILPDDDQLLMISRKISIVGLEFANATCTPTLADQVALLYAVLALAALSRGHMTDSAALSEELDRTIGLYSGPPTFHLCLAMYLQHVYVLATGTLNRARSVITNTIQIAHDISLYKMRSAHDIRGLQLYLLILLADQCVFSPKMPRCKY